MGVLAWFASFVFNGGLFDLGKNENLQNLIAWAGLLSFVGWGLVTLIAYFLTLVWSFRSFDNLRVLVPGYRRVVSIVATLCLAVIYVGFFLSFFLGSYLYRRSSPDESVRSKSFWRVPWFVLWRCLLVNVLWWTIWIWLANFQAIPRILPEDLRPWLNTFLMIYVFNLICLSTWCLVTFIREVTEMQEERYEQVKTSHYTRCPQCGEEFQSSLSECPLCGASQIQPVNTTSEGGRS